MKLRNFNFRFRSSRLFDVWFSLLVMLLAAIMIEYVINFSMFNLIRVGFTGLILALSFNVYFRIAKRKYNIAKQRKKLQKAYTAQLRRKDMRIKELKEHNELLIKTSVKQAKRIVEISDNARELMKTI